MIRFQFVNQLVLISLLSILFSFSLHGQTKEALESFKKKYPKEHLIQLKDYQKVSITYKKGVAAVVYHFDWDFLVLDKNGSISLAEQEIRYSTFEEVENIEAYTLVPKEKGSTKLNITSIETSDAETSGAIFHDGDKVKKIIYPGLTEGALCHLSYDMVVNDATFPFSYNFFSFFPCENNSMIIETDSAVNINYKLLYSELLPITFKEELLKGKRVLSWTASQSLLLKSEDYDPGPRYYAPHLLAQIGHINTKAGILHYGETIEDLHNNYKKNVEEVENETLEGELARVADSITKPYSNEFDKVKAIYYWVQDHIKYIAFEEGDGGFVPRQPSFVLHKRFGDCKDMASLIYSLAKAVNIQTYLTWIGSRDLPYKYTEFPSQFCDNHMITTYKHEGKNYFLDATNSFIPMGLPTSFIQGKEAMLHIGKDQYEIVEVPETPGLTNYLVDTIFVKIEGKGLKGTSKSYNNGYYHSMFADAAKGMPEKDFNKFSTSAFEKGNNSFVTSNTVFEHLLDREKPVIMGFDWKVDNYVSELGNEIYINMLLDKELMRPYLLKPNRIAPFELPHKVLNANFVTLEIPAGFKVKYLPKGNEFNYDKFNLKVNYAVVGNTVTMYFELTTDFLILPVSEFEKWAEFARVKKEVFSESLVLQKIN